MYSFPYDELSLFNWRYIRPKIFFVSALIVSQEWLKNCSDLSEPLSVVQKPLE